MNELQETIKSICDEFADISAILAARSRELDRRELFDKEIETEINNIKRIDMKTNEELQGMTHDELVAYAEELQTDLKSSRSSLTFYCEEKNKLEEV